MHQPQKCKKDSFGWGQLDSVEYIARSDVWRKIYSLNSFSGQWLPECKVHSKSWIHDSESIIEYGTPSFFGEPQCCASTTTHTQFFSTGVSMNIYAHMPVANPCSSPHFQRSDPFSPSFVCQETPHHLFQPVLEIRLLPAVSGGHATAAEKRRFWWRNYFTLV